MRHWKIAILAASMLAIGFTSFARAEAPFGIWLVSGMKIEIKQCGQELCGVIVGLKNPKGADTKNGKPLIGTSVFSNMRPKQANVWTGNLYNPIDGGSYKDVTLTIVSDDRMNIRGCKLFVLCGDIGLKRSSLEPTKPAKQANPSAE